MDQQPNNSTRTALTVGIVLGVLALAQFAPGVHGSPAAYDPYLIRDSLAAWALYFLSLAYRPLRPSAALIGTIAVIIGSFSLWLWLPNLLFGFGNGVFSSFNIDIALATIVQLLITIFAFWMMSRMHHAPGLIHYPWSIRRLRVLCGSLGLVIAFLLISSLIPAGFLGRYAIVPASYGNDLWALIIADALQGIIQEFQFRGALLSTLERSTPPLLANGLQALVFGAVHIAVTYEGPGVPLIPIAILLGLILGYSVQKTKSLIPATVLHAIVDIWVSIVIVSGLYGGL